MAQSTPILSDGPMAVHHVPMQLVPIRVTPALRTAKDEYAGHR